ncbi:MAG: nucleotidyltransferase domain-containing protein [Pseudomonadota bacterium]|uniref:Nucleotidyltransferase domain-containing protein n=1 Tax=Candidatus Desulfatibia profunda TaxID=2841695 RepID=A0A8J6NYJ2_9BACT|nr:nucleotidyltransferase domain-containing protein [Candidatus Desulfatibia profunda]MBL7181158.1 nucleotidyltransferase domain-containing protein [Desulfobacterales bacterium]
MKVDDTLIQTAIERILNVVSPERIILFGSAAAGQITLESDIDLLVIEKSFTGRREESVWLRKAIADLGVPVDVFAMTPERFEETKDVIGGLAYPANKYGKVVYEAA